MLRYNSHQNLFLDVVDVQKSVIGMTWDFYSIFLEAFMRSIFDFFSAECRVHILYQAVKQIATQKSEKYLYIAVFYILWRIGSRLAFFMK